MSKFTVKMQLAKQTKNTYMFKELDDNNNPIESMYEGKIGQLYVKQSNFTQRPDIISVTVETES